MPTLAPRPTQLTPTTRRRGLSTRTKVIVAVAGSLLLHAILLLVLGWVVPHWPHTKLKGTPPPIQLTFTPSKPAAPTAAQPSGNKNPDYIRTLDDRRPGKTADDPAFISDKDTKAAALLAASGNKPLPSTEGKDVPTFDFEPRPYRPGKPRRRRRASAPTAQATPGAGRRPNPARARTRSALQEPPDAQTARPRPASRRTRHRQDRDVPHPRTAHPDARPRHQHAAARPATVAAQRRQSERQQQRRPKPPGYQPQSIATKMTGSINNRGRRRPRPSARRWAVTRKAVNDQIGMLWYSYTENPGAVLSTGTVKIHFYVTASGTVKKVRRLPAATPTARSRLFSERHHRGRHPADAPEEVARQLAPGWKRKSVLPFTRDRMPCRSRSPLPSGINSLRTSSRRRAVHGSADRLRAIVAVVVAILRLRALRREQVLPRFVRSAIEKLPARDGYRPHLATGRGKPRRAGAHHPGRVAAPGNAARGKHRHRANRRPTRDHAPGRRPRRAGTDRGHLAPARAAGSDFRVGRRVFQPRRRRPPARTRRAWPWASRRRSTRRSSAWPSPSRRWWSTRFSTGASSRWPWRWSRSWRACFPNVTLGERRPDF